jgi:hypothetical protein
MAMSKKTKAILEAEALLDVCSRDAENAKANLRELETKESEAYAALREAKRAADAGLPQCQMATISWRASKVDSSIPVVIVRKTAAGALVVRVPGEFGMERRFKSSRGEWVPATKTSGWSGYVTRLRDVPAEYEPKEQQT